MSKSMLRIALLGLILVCLGAAAMANVPPPEHAFRIGGSCVWLDGKIYTAGGILWNSSKGGFEDFIDAEGKVYQTSWGSAGVSVYDPENGWSSSKYDGTGPLGFDPDNDGVCEWSGNWNELGLWTQSNQGVAYDHKFYIVAGRTQGQGEIWCYDPNAGDDGRGRWSFVTQNSEWPSFRRGAVGLYGSKIFLASGSSRGKFASFDIADTTGDPWTTYDTASPDVDQCGATVCNGKFYIVGGRTFLPDGSAGDISSAIYACDLSNPDDGFTPVGTLHTAVAYPAVVNYGGIIYILGGKKADGSAAVDIQTYDPSNNQVHNLTAESPYGQAPVQIPSPGWAWNACVDPNGILYLGCGAASGSDSERPSAINPPWFKCDINQLRVDLFDSSMGAEPGCFPYEDWESRSATLSGKVVDSNGFGVPYAVVGFKSGEFATADAFIYATADKDGNYGPIEVAPFCTYCAAWAPGWTPSTDYPLTLVAGEVVNKDLTLDTPVGKNIAPGENSGVIGDHTSESGYFDTNIIDGNLDTRWSSGDGGLEQTIGVYYSAEAIPVNGITIYWDAALVGAYTVEYTDDPMLYFAQWTPIYDCDNANGGYHVGNGRFVDAIRFKSAVNAVAFRIVCREPRPGSNNYSIWELQVHSNTEFEPKPCYISGRVVDSDNNGVSGVAVGLKNGRNATADADLYLTSNEDGTFGPFSTFEGYYCAAWGLKWTPSADYEITESTNDFVITLDQLAGRNLSVDGTVTAYSFGEEQEPWSGGSRAESAIDADMWYSHWWGYNDEEYIEFSLNGTYDIYGVTVVWRDKAASYDIQYADENGIWQTAYTCENRPQNGYYLTDWGLNADAIRFIDPVTGVATPVTATAIRLNCHKRVAGGYEVYSIMAHSSTDVPIKVSGIVVDSWDNGIGGVAVGSKDGLNATADARDYVTTEDDGTFEIYSYPGYYCAAWGMGWLPSADYKITGPTTNLVITLDKAAGINLSSAWQSIDCSFEEEHEGGSKPESALDSDWQNSHWWSNGDPNHHLAFTLDDAYDIDGITICWGAHARSYKVEYADVNGNWQKIYECSGNGDNGYYICSSPIYGEDIYVDAIRLTNPVVATGIKVSCSELATGNYGIYSIMVHYAGEVNWRSISEIKQSSDGDFVQIDGNQIVATPGGGLPDNVAYIETPGRFAGLRVDTSRITNKYGLADYVYILGKVETTDGGEKYINAYDLAVTDACARPIQALGMNTRFASTPLAQGLLVKLCGTVEEGGEDFYFLNDGGVTMKVYCGDLAKPSAGDVVRVRGVLSVDNDGTTCLLTRCASDRVFASAEYQTQPLLGRSELRDWLILGLYGEQEDQTVALATDYIKEADPSLTEESVYPNLGDTVGNKEWFRSDAFLDRWDIPGGYGAAVELNRLFGGNNNQTAYAHVYVYSETEQEVDMRVCSDDGMKIWLNGVNVATIDEWRGYGGEEDWVENVILNKGWNRILVKVHNGLGDFGFRVRFVEDDTDTPVKGLSYYLDKKQ